MRYKQDPENNKLLKVEDFFRKYPNKVPKPRAFLIIGDYEPFQAVCGDGVEYTYNEAGKITDIKLPVMTSRAKYKEYQKRNGLQEAGTELSTFMDHGGKTKENWESCQVDPTEDVAAAFRYEKFDRS